MVKKLTKPAEKIRTEMSGEKWNSLNEAIQTFLAAGQKLDQMKKLAVYNKSGIPHNATPARVPAMNDSQYQMLHMAVGIAGEASEILECIMNYCITGVMDKENFVEEFGDLEFYMQGARAEMDITRLMTLTHNLRKLSVRYAGFEYTDKAAHARADKN
jgi:hypothetical protein